MEVIDNSRLAGAMCKKQRVPPDKFTKSLSQTWEDTTIYTSPQRNAKRELKVYKTTIKHKEIMFILFSLC